MKRALRINLFLISLVIFVSVLILGSSFVFAQTVDEDVVDGGVHGGSNVLEEIVEEHEGNIEETNAGIKHGNFYFIEREIFEVFDIYGIYYF